MVTMKTWGILGITAALVLGGARSYADNTKTRSTATTGKVRTAVYQAPEAPAATAREIRPVRAITMDLGSAKPCPTEMGLFAAPPQEKCCATPSRSHLCRFWDWLTYRPVTHYNLCGADSSCTPPLFAYYLDYCPLPPAPNLGYPSPACASQRCSTKSVNEEVAEKEGSSLAPRSFFGWLSDKRPAKPSTAKSIEHAPVKQDEVQTASRKVIVEMKKPDEDVLMGGKESSKWRGMPARPQEAGRR